MEETEVTTLEFDLAKLTAELDALPKRLRVAFAAACVQRQLPSYLRYARGQNPKDGEEMADILFRLWNAIERNQFASDALRRDRALCETLIPGDDHGDFEGWEYAEDAALSLCYAIEAELTAKSENAAHGAHHAYAALDDYVIGRFDVDVNAPGARQRIDSFPIVQAEFRRQQADLAELRSAALAPGRAQGVIERIKLRAERDSASFFGEA
jgi:hypothetical protein